MAIENVDALEKAMKLPEGTLKTALESEESVSIEIPNLIVRTPEEDETRTSNLKDEYKTEYHTAGREIAIKEIKRELGLEFEGKNMSNLMSAHKEFILKDASVEPTQKIKDLQSDNDLLRGNFTKLQGDFDERELTFKRESDKRDIDNSILKEISDDLPFSKEDALVIFNNKVGVKHSEYGIESSIDGKILKDDTLTLVPLKSVVNSFFDSYVKKPVTGGAGGKDEPTTGGGAQTDMDKFIKRQQDAGNSVGSQSFNEAMSKEVQAGTLKI